MADAESTQGYADLSYQTRMNEEIQESEIVMQSVRANMIEYYKAYRLSADLEAGLPYNPTVRLPLAAAALNVSVARFVTPFLMETDPIVVKALDAHSTEAADAQEALLNNQWRDRRYLNGREFVQKIVKIAYLGGTAWVFPDWRTEKYMIREEREVVTPITGRRVMVPAEFEINFDGPRWPIIHPFDAWPDVMSDNEVDPRFFYCREQLNYSEFAGLVESGYYSGPAAEAILKSGQAIPEYAGGTSTDSRFDLPLAARIAAPDYQGYASGEFRNRPVYLFHRFDMDTWTTTDPFGCVLREVENPTPDKSFPVRGLRLSLDTQGPIGIPGSESSHGMNILSNRLASGVMTYIDRVITPTMGIEATAVDFVGSCEISGAPWEMITLPSPDAIFPVNKDPGTLPYGFDGVAFFKDFSERGSAVNDFKLGHSAGQAPPTATGIERFVQQGDTLFAVSFAQVAEFIREISELTGLYNQTLLEKPQWVSRVGKVGASAETFEVSREMLQGRFRYDTTVTSGKADPMQLAQGIGAMVNLFGQSGALDIPYLARETAKLIGMKNPELAVPGYIPKPLPIEDAVEVVRVGIPVVVTPGENHYEAIDAYGAAAMAARADGREDEAQRFIEQAMKHQQAIMMMAQAGGRGMDVGNMDGQKDEGPKSTGQRLAADGGVGPGGGSPGPLAVAGRDQRGVA